MNSAFRIRIPCAVGADPTKTPAFNALTGKAPAFWNGNNLGIEFALLDASGATVQTDFSNVASVTVEIKTNQSTDSLLASKTIAVADLNTALDQAGWDAGTAQHGTATFAASETRLISSGTTLTAWLVISYLTTDSPADQVTVYGGPITIIQDNSPSGGSVVTPNDPDYYTAAAADARYPLRSETNANWRFANGQFQLWDDVTNSFRAAGFHNGVVVAV